MKIPGLGTSKWIRGFEPSFRSSGRKILRPGSPLSSLALKDEAELEFPLSDGECIVLARTRPRKVPCAWKTRMSRMANDNPIIAKTPDSILTDRVMLRPIMKTKTSSGLIFQNSYKVFGG